jgi:hypothetical protein
MNKNLLEEKTADIVKSSRVVFRGEEGLNTKQLVEYIPQRHENALFKKAIAQFNTLFIKSLKRTKI